MHYQGWMTQVHWRGRLLNRIPHVDIYREPGVLYLRRYYLLGGPRLGTQPWYKRFNLYLHCFFTSDDPVPHNHPWAGWSLILRGAYWEHRLEGGLLRGRLFSSGHINRLGCDTFHYVNLCSERVWTLFVAGPRKTSWGFMTSDGFVDWKTYTKGKGVE
jgi:hypothetical protein